MPTGETHSGSNPLANPVIIASARKIREFEGVHLRTTDRVPQKKGTGLEWQEYSFNKLTGQGITETQQNENFQQISGQLLTLEPDMSQIVIKMTDRTKRRMAQVALMQMGGLAGNAMARKQDEDYLALFSGFSTTSSPGTGNPVSFGHIAAAVTNSTSNVTEPSQGDEVFAVLHGRQIKDIQDEVLAGVGTYTIPEGLTAETFRKGFKGTVAGANLFEDGLINVDSTPDANGAVHTRKAVVSVTALELRSAGFRDELFGGGADVDVLTNEYGFVERTSAGTQVWAYRIFSDATAPTS
ncbi:hypothetical protein LCGC14_1146780 [marine sediment metagenome]|uniref:Uncharacterized protein n=1 Tax=marine sediment metagenome TaxID=412755 RepID=A0A0F9LWM1_9ZZZZ